MFLRILAALSAYVSLTSASISDCSDANTLFKISSMSFSPEPPVIGQNSTLILGMEVPEVITDGTATYSVTLNYIPFQPTVDPLCDTTIPCPIEVGHLDTTSSFAFPDVNGLMTLEVVWADGAGRQLMCVQIKETLADPDAANKQLVLYTSPRVWRRVYLRGAAINA